MSSSLYTEARVKKVETGIKIESEQQSIPKQSTISPFLSSGQAAFGHINARLLENHNQASGEVQKWMLEQIRERLAAASELNHDDITILRPLLKLEYMSNVTGLQCLFPELSRLMRSNLTYAVAFTNGVLDASADEVPPMLKDDLLRGVAQYMDAVSIDMREHETVDRQLAAFDRKHGSTDASGSRPLAKLSPVALSLFTKRLYGSGLFQPVELMLARLRSQMDHALVMDLHKTYIPFLQDLIALMLIFGIPSSNVIYSGFFEGVLCNYLQRFVGQETKNTESVGHRSWALRVHAARCTLGTFDHSYFRSILGDRYEIVIPPAFQSPPQDSSTHGQSDSSSTSQ